MRRAVISIGALVVLGLQLTASPVVDSTVPRVVRNRPPLQPGAFTLLPLGSIEPEGWLRRQLEIQAKGLTGRLDEFWPDVGAQSGWLGGPGESWERGPYYLDGLLPLAYLLKNDGLIAKANRYVEWTLAHQQPSGWLGPPSNTDWWPNMVMLKVLTQYQEATGDPRVVPALTRYFHHHLEEAGRRPLKDWAIYRWADELLSIVWLYNRTADPQLLTLARTLQNQGTDWRQHFARFELTSKTTTQQLGWGVEPKGLPDLAMRAHGVNNAMALKTPAIWSLLSGEPADRDATLAALDVLDRYHGQPNGMFSADEHYAGRDPSEGTELCAVVEAMFSIEQSLAVSGGVALAERLERIAYNALPATLSADMWSHQYDQQANQVLCSLNRRRWVSNGPESNLFGLEPNFGCCTANLHQGWPKLVASLWMASPDNGLAAGAYGPSKVSSRVGRGVPVTIEERTDYPFRDAIELVVRPQISPLTFPLHLRIPRWTTSPTIRVNGHPVPDVAPGGFARIERAWRAGDRIAIQLPMTPATSNWYRDSIAIERGPLVFSLPVGEDWRRLTTGVKKPAPSPAADWEVHPTTAWNYGLVLDPSTAARLVVDQGEVGAVPFAAGAPAVTIRVTGRRVPEWQLEDGSAGTLPRSPVISREPNETLRLVPYGSARLRVTEFPRIEP
jgi:Beta-L-arabinofuranosidase, GH127 middle domain/Beta-L-arabinofuranosidase, GH127 catalytic domain